MILHATIPDRRCPSFHRIVYLVSLLLTETFSNRPSSTYLQNIVTVYVNDMETRNITQVSGNTIVKTHDVAFNVAVEASLENILFIIVQRLLERRPKINADTGALFSPLL